jgi:nucleoid DNA-binding protein
MPKVTRQEILDALYTKWKQRRSGLVTKVDKSLGLVEEYRREDLTEILDDIVTLMVSGLRQGATIEIRGFGTLKPVPRRTHAWFSGVTGKMEQGKPGFRVKFRPGKDLDWIT